jgi:hypothetical protein
MKQICAALIVFQFLAFPIAQASEVRAYYERDSIWAPPRVVVDGKAYDPHFFTGFSDLSEAMKSNAEAVEFAERARKQALWGSILATTGLVAAITYLTTGRDRDIGTYWTIFLVGFIPGLLLQESSRINAVKAINRYNGVGGKAWQLLPEKIFAGPLADGGGAGLGWSF